MLMRLSAAALYRHLCLHHSVLHMSNANTAQVLCECFVLQRCSSTRLVRALAIYIPACTLTVVAHYRIHVRKLLLAYMRVLPAAAALLHRSVDKY
jgi:hypothetical protein